MKLRIWKTFHAMDPNQEKTLLHRPKLVCKGARRHNMFYLGQ